MNRRAIAGFTLVELLVVIGIIAVLIAILLPALSKARQAAQTVACASNLRQIGMGFQFYNDNNKGYFPPHFGDARITWPSGSTASHWMAFVAPYMGWNRETAVGQFRVPAIFRCPMFEPTQLVTFESTAANWYNASYGYNYQYLSANSGYPAPKRTQIRRPTDKIVAADSGESVLYPPGGLILVNVWDGGGYPVSKRHNLGSNVVFVDGHVEHKYYKDIQTPTYEYVVRNRYWDAKAP